LYLIGEVSNTLTQEVINNTIRQLELTPLVEQLPPTHAITPYYHAAQVTILPSISEGSPNVILESLASGTPVIASTAANTNGDVLHEINGWLFPAGNAKALANCLINATNTPPETLKLMGDHSREIAVKYDIDHIVQQYAEVYEFLLNSP